VRPVPPNQRPSDREPGCGPKPGVDRAGREEHGRLNLSPLAIAFGIVGLAWGFAADRLGARWPAHEDGSVRRLDWRTIVVVGIGGFAMAALPGRFSEPLHLAAFGAYGLALTLLLATDLDQRLLPDIVTLPMIPLAFLFALSGQNPLVGGALILAIVAAVAIPAVLYIPSLAFGPGAFGLGDVKLLVTVGLVSGAYRALAGTVAGLFLAGAVIVVLLIARRITLRSYIPFGPFLIVGAFWAVLMPVG